MNKVMTRIDAVISLRPNAQWSVEDNIITWHDTVQTRPTDGELDVEVLRLQAEYDSLEYSRLRKAEYDKLEQDEMRYDDLINGTTTWPDAIAAIKARFPKPTI